MTGDESRDDGGIESLDEDEGLATDRSAGSATDDDGTDRRARLVRIGHVLGVLLLIAIVLPFLLFAVPQLIGAESSYVVVSGSMEPVMSPYDVTFVDEVDPAEVEEGDIINFQRSQDQRTTTHRVVEVTERDGQPAFRTEGDNNDGPDPGVVTVDEFRGKVMEVGGSPLVIPYVGRVIEFASSGIGFALLFVVPVALLIVNELWNVVSSAKPSSETSVSPDGGERTGGERSRAVGNPVDEGTTDDSATNDDGSTVSFSAGELRLAIAILVAFVAYGAWTTVNDLTPLNVGVTGSATVALLLLAGLYVVGGGSSDSESSSGGASEGPRDEDVDGLVIHHGSIDHNDAGADPEPVQSFELLVDLAETSDGRLYRDPDEGVFHLTVGGRLYAYDPDRETAAHEVPERDDVEYADGGTASYWGPPPDAADSTEDTGSVAEPIGEGDDA